MRPSFSQTLALGSLLTLFGASCSSAQSSPPAQSNGPSDVHITKVVVREVDFAAPVEGKTHGLEFELSRSGGGFPVRGNADPELLVGDQVIKRHRFSKEGVVFMAPDGQPLPSGGRIIVRWGESPSAPSVDTGVAYNPDDVITQ